MSCLLIFKAEGRQLEVEKSLRAILANYQSVECMPGVFIVGHLHEWQYYDLVQQVQQLAQHHDPLMNLLVTPLIERGKFDGWLQENTWRLVNKVVAGS